MHIQQARFVMALREQMSYLFHGSSVLEVGSYNVNGSIRQYFNSPSNYVGIDLIEGPGVDVVANGATYQGEQKFDLVISTECFEHAPNFLDIFINMIHNCARQGIVAFTCATTGRPEHGTRRTSPADSPGTVGIGQDHYRNITKEDFPPGLLTSEFWAHQFFTNDETHDLYFVGICPSDPLADESFEAIAQYSGARKI